MSFLTNMFGDTKVDAPAPVTSTIAGFSGGGLSGTQNKTKYLVRPDAMRTGTVGDLSGTYGTLGDITGDLRATVAPGFNDLLRTRLDSINDSAHKAIGDLRQNLQSRRVLGSSFGNDTLTRAEAEFGRVREQATADSFLKSLDVNNQLLQQQYKAYSDRFNTKLAELNLEGGIASQFASKASDIFAANAQLTSKLSEQANEFNAKMSNDQASGLGSLLGKAAFAPVTGGGSLFGNVASKF